MSEAMAESDSDTAAVIGEEKPTGYSPLHLAILEKDEESVNQLLESGCQVDVEDNRRQTPLHLAVKEKFHKGVELLLAKQSNVNAQDEDGNTPVHLVYQSKYWESETNWDSTEEDSAQTDDMNTVIGRRFCHSLCKLLINHGSDLELKNSKGQTLLHLAVLRNITSICRLISGKHVDVNVQDENHQTPLLIAVRKDYFSISRILLMKGALVNVKDINGNYPLHFAVATGNKTLVKLLLNNGAEIDVKNGSGQTALHISVKDPKCQSSVVQLLLERRGEVNEQDDNGDTPLHLAVESRRNNYDDYWEVENIIKILLDWGANMEITNVSGVSPLGRTANAEWRNIFTEHIVKLRAAKFPNDVQYQFDGNFPEEYEESCLEELDRMKVFKFGHHSLYEFICNSNNPLFFINSDLDNIIPCFENTFPKYDTILRAKVIKARQRKVLLCGARKCLNLPLPKNIFDTILFFGSNKDLENIIKANEKHTSYYLKLTADVKHNWYQFSESFSQESLPIFKAIKNRAIDDLKVCLKQTLLLPDTLKQPGENFLHYAVTKNFEEGVRTLLASGMNINIKGCDGETPLHCAALKHKETIADLLITSGADVDCENEYGQTPLHVAVSARNVYITALLLEKGCKVNTIDKEGHSPLLSLFIYWSYERNTAEICDLLIAHGADPNVKDTNGLTPFMHAIGSDCPPSLCQLLLNSGADMNTVDSKNRTPLHVVCNRDKHYEDVCGMLLSRGANVGAKDIQGRTPLHLAAKYKKIGLLKLFLKEGGDMRAKDSKDQTILHYAAKNNEEANCVRCLLENGMDVNPRDAGGKTPIHYCLSTWYDSKLIVMELMDWGGPQILKFYQNMAPLVKDANSVKWNCFVKCIIKLHCAKLIDSVPYVFMSTKLKTFQTYCFMEVKLMKSTVFGQNSCFEIITNYSDPRYVLNNEMEEALRSDKLKFEFPIYSSLLYVTFIKAQKRFALLNSAQEHFKIDLPFETVRHILTYLSDDDLMNMVNTLGCKVLERIS